MNLSYTAKSLEDIAKSFDVRARQCDTQAKACKGQKNKTYYEAQSGVWSTAAEILRNTELKPENGSGT